MHRRLNDPRGADGLVAQGRSHPAAATRWERSVQTPRVFTPGLASTPWWDADRFGISAALEAAWASGAIGADLRRLPFGGRAGGDLGGGDQFERIVLTGSQVRPKASEDDLRGAGAWSEFMLFDGAKWNEERCKAAATICALLRSAPEVSGAVEFDGGRIHQQGEVTIFRLLPGAHLMPHVGVTNRRLVLQAIAHSRFAHW